MPNPDSLSQESLDAWIDRNVTCLTPEQWAELRQVVSQEIRKELEGLTEHTPLAIIEGNDVGHKPVMVVPVNRLEARIAYWRQK